jgi:hypothetical protein
MFDDVDHLRDDAGLLQLLSHYAEAGSDDRAAWQDRVMQLDGAAPEALVKLHGRLLACDWIEQNTGAAPGLRDGRVPCCYRVTTAGQRALKQARARREAEEDELSTA